MSREVGEISSFLEQIRAARSSLSEEDVEQVAPCLDAIDRFLASASIAEEQLLAVVQRLERRSRDLALTWASQQDADVSTRMGNISGWELACLVGLVCSHHVFVTTKSKQYASSACIDLYINSVDFLLSHEEARSRAHAAILVRAVAKSMVIKSLHVSQPWPSKSVSSVSSSEDTDGGSDSSSGRSSEVVCVYERLYDIILRHVALRLRERDAETRPVRLTGGGQSQGVGKKGSIDAAKQQEELELDDLR